MTTREGSTPHPRRRKLAALGLGLAAVVGLAGLLGWHVLGPRATPPGQPPLGRLSTGDLGVLREAFNAAQGETRLLVLVSPT